MKWIRDREEGDRPHGGAAEEQALFRALASGDRRVKEKIVRRFYPLAVNVATSRAAWKENDDLIQEAYIALDYAVDRFDYGRGTRFSTYATSVIGYKLTSYLRRARPLGEVSVASMDEYEAEPDDLYA